MPKMIALLLVLAGALAVVPRANALPPALGTLTLQGGPQGGDPYACAGARNGADFFAGMNCYNATVSCPGIADIGLTFGWTGPAKPQGTVVFFSGGKGTAPTEDGDDIPVYAATYVNSFEIVYIEWNTPWEDPSSGGRGLAQPYSSTTRDAPPVAVSRVGRNADGIRRSCGCEALLFESH